MSSGHTDAGAEFSRANGPLVTKISLSPMIEGDIVQYVAQTLSRPRDEVLSLALVIQAKTAGNPFYIREMLKACYQKQCIWYDYRDTQWHYDLDRLFEQFQGEKNYDILDTSFVTRRLDDLPRAARAILAWGATVGNVFSFELICHLLGDEFVHQDDQSCVAISDSKTRRFSKAEAVAGLQSAIQAYIIVPGETDDQFRFAHDRYVQASLALKECNAEQMHFVIAQTLLKYYAVEAWQHDSTADHICEAADIIKKRVARRQPFRKLLIDCAQSATESGARPTAAKYYKTAVRLLQDNPWTDDVEDASYEETIQLYLRSAQCHIFMGQHDVAHDQLREILKNARTAPDKSPAYVLQSRISAQSGDSETALTSLKGCLDLLGVTLDDDPSYEKCDLRFENIIAQIKSMDSATLQRPVAKGDPGLYSIGTVLSETIGAAWWSDCLRFYHLTLTMIEMHLSKGAFHESGLAFLWLASISLSRFNKAELAVELGQISQEMLLQSKDSFSMARGFTLYPSYVGHICCSMKLLVSQMEDAVELASIAGDRMSTIHSYGISASIKFFSSENCSDLEGYCQYACEEIPKWHLDTRGGTILIAVRQTCRAMQGKTNYQSPLEVLSSDDHNAVAYKDWLISRTAHSNRSTIFYECMEIVPLFLFGHYDRAIEVGTRCHEKISMLWSTRHSRLALFFYGLALTGRLLRTMQDPCSPQTDFTREVEFVVKTLQGFVGNMRAWASLSDVNYLAWIKLLDSQIFELQGSHGEAIQAYEEALDHSSEQGFVFEEALGNYLLAGFFLRRKASRSARAALMDAVALYRQLSATGIAKNIEEEHSLLLHGPARTQRTSDAMVQTDFVADTASVAQYRPVDGIEVCALTDIPPSGTVESSGERIGAWRGSMSIPSAAGAGLPALDMIDLHAILVSSQVISSVLQVDQLLKTMCDVILQTCGGSATSAAIVVQDNDADTWCIAASGDPEKGATAHNPGLPLFGTSLLADNVVFYCTRFLESVFISDMLSDERFGNVSDSWLQSRPFGRAIIAIPICHGTKPLLGVLYLEGEPGSFTDRNVTVLQLLVNQIGISYSNALSMKNLEKISAENRSMVSVQKRALAKALEAETKAKDAEAEAKRNVRLAE